MATIKLSSRYSSVGLISDSILFFLSVIHCPTQQEFNGGEKYNRMIISSENRNNRSSNKISSLFLPKAVYCAEDQSEKREEQGVQRKDRETDRKVGVLLNTNKMRCLRSTAAHA